MKTSSRHGLPSWIDGLSRPLNGLRMTEMTIFSYFQPSSLLTVSFIEIGVGLVILHVGGFEVSRENGKKYGEK